MSYNTSLDLHKEIYENSTTLVFEVIAIDNGTAPRGSSATVNITISNTCLLDARYTNTEYKITINDSTGELLLTIPKYYVYPYGESMQNKPHYKKRLDNRHRFLHIFFLFFFYNSVLCSFQDYFSSYEMRQSVGWAKMGEPREKIPGTLASRTKLVSHVASAGLEPTPDTAVR